MLPRFGVIGLWHETNTYSSAPTTLNDFARFELAGGSELAERNIGTGSVIGGFLATRSAELVPIFAAGAWPSGPVDEEVLSTLLDRLAAGLRAAGPLDGVLVNLHGAMVATRTADVELAVLGLVREIIGPKPVGVVLDLHANPSPAMVGLGDVFVSYDTFPHVDMFERGREVAALLARSVTGTPLRTTIRKIPLLVSPIAQSTDAGPLAQVQRRARTRAADAGLARIAVAGGFAFSDVDRAGMSVLAVHEEADATAAGEVLDGVVDDIAAVADDFAVARDDVPTAVRRAVESTRSPVFLVDVADNVGGGSPGDGTSLLGELLRVRVRSAVVTIADREVARIATAAGIGAEIDVALGGKTDRLHGRPLLVRATVRRLSDGRYRSNGYYLRGQTFSMGTTAVLDVQGITVVVSEFAVPPFHSEQLTSLSIRPEDYDIVVVKGALAWRQAYEGIPAEIIEVATPGICPVDVSTLQRRTVPVRV